jgi:hypothetical protein
MPSAPDALSETAHRIADLIIERIDPSATVAPATSLPASATAKSGRQGPSTDPG